MKLVTALALVSLAVAAGGVVLSANLYPPDDPYFKFGVVMLAVPPAAIGLLLLAPWPSLRITAGWLALVLGFLWVVAGGSGVLGGIMAIVGGAEQQDLAGTLVWGTATGMIAGLNLAIFWAAVLRDRGSRTSSPPHSAAA